MGKINDKGNSLGIYRERIIISSWIIISKTIAELDYICEIEKYSSWDSSCTQLSSKYTVEDISVFR